MVINSNAEINQNSDNVTTVFYNTNKLQKFIIANSINHSCYLIVVSFYTFLLSPEVSYGKSIYTWSVVKPVQH